MGNRAGVSEEIVRRDEIARRGLPAKHSELPSDLRDAILESVKRILEVLPVNAKLELRFGDAGDHYFGPSGEVGFIPSKRDVRLYLRAEQGVVQDPDVGPDMIQGGEAEAMVVDRDGKLALLLVNIQGDWSVAHPRGWW
jgi:hypothetical protein